MPDSTKNFPGVAEEGFDGRRVCPACSGEDVTRKRTRQGDLETPKQMSPKRLKAQQTAFENMVKSGEKMNKNLSESDVLPAGAIVRLTIPTNDRVKEDKIIGVVLQRKDDKYRVGFPACILSVPMIRRDLDHLQHQTLEQHNLAHMYKTFNAPTSKWPTVSLREAVRLTQGAPSDISCNCTKGCTSLSCICLKNQALCVVGKCHPKHGVCRNCA